MKRKNQTMKRFLAFLLSAALIITYMPSGFFAYAEDAGSDQAVAEQQAEEAAPAAETKAEAAPKVEEEPAPEPAPEAAEEPAPEPAPEVAEEPAPEPEPEAVEEAAEEPAPEAVEEAAEESAPEAAEEPAVEAAPEAVEEPAEEAAPEAAEKPAEEAAPKAAEKPAEEAAPEAAEESAEEAAPAEEAVPVDEEAAEEETPDEAEEEAEVEYPAYTFTGSDNGVSVKVDAPEGALPKGTIMSVKGVGADSVMDAVEDAVEGEVKTVKAVDITFIYEGKEIEPKKPVSVRLSAKGMDNDANQSIVHIDDNGEASVVTENVSNGTATFKSDDFSVYIVVDSEIPSEDENAVATYKFYVGDELKSTQYIKTGDTLADPGDLAGDGATTVFKGWYVKEGQDIDGETPGEKLTFGVKDPVPTTEVIEIEAKVETTYYVTFLGEPDGEGGRGIAAVDTVTVDGPEGTEGTLDISGRTITPKEDTSAFEGWSATDSGDVITDTSITVKKSTKLYAVVVEANWIHFDENVDWDTSDSDPTYTGPVYVKKTDDLSTKKPTDPTRPGYKFGGWYEDTDCTQAFEWSGTGLKRDIILYAKWEPDKSGYTVIIWKQKVSDDKNAADDAKTYDFESSTGVEAMTGDTLSEDQFTEYTEYDFNGFHYSNRIKIEPDSTVRADNTTVVNVYYDRNLLTINFYDGGDTHPEYTATESTGGEQQYGLVDDEYVTLTRRGNQGNRYWTYSVQTEYSGPMYREATGNTGTQYGFSGGEMVELTLVNDGCGGSHWELPNGNRYNGTRYFEGAGGNSGVGIVDGNTVNITQDEEGWKYGKEVTYTGTRYVVTQVQDPVYTYTGLYGSTLASNGYSWPDTRDWYERQNSGGTRLTFLDAFKFDGLSGVSEDNTVLSQYGANPSGSNTIRFYKQNIDETWPTNPTNSVSARDGTFTITEKYEGFTAVSYSHNGTNWTDTHAGVDNISTSGLRIRFQRNKYTLTFVDPKTGDTIGTQENIPYEDTMSKYKISDPEKKHYDFGGWCEDPAGVAQFNWNSTMPAANKVLYAKWTPKQYNVKLDTNGGHFIEGSTVDEDFNVPLDTVLSKPGLFQSVEYDDKHELVGWFYKNDDGSAGDVYDYGKIEEDVKLIAKWRIPGQVSIIYDAGEGGSNPPVDEYKYATDSSVVLGAPPETINENYSFVGWKLKDKDGNVLDKVYYSNNTFDITEDLIADYDVDTKTGKIYVVAVYNKTNEGPFEKTYIRWFANDGSDCFHTDILDDPTGDVDDSTLLVNQMVDIQSAPTRDGYIFLGWAKVEDTGANISKEQELTAADLFIKYENGAFSSAETGTACTKVAADNDKKYEALFGVWDYEKYTVVYTDGVEDEKVFDDEEHPNLTVKDTTPEFNNGTDPTRKYYDFDGWDPAYQEKLDIENADEDNVITYTAKWKEKEVTINYAVASDSTDMGSVSPESETVKVLSGTASGSTASPASDKYVFDYWTVDNGSESISTNAKYVPSKNSDGAYETHTYYAHFKLNVADVTVHHYLKGTTDKIADDDSEEVTIGEEFTATPKTEYQGNTVEVASYDPDQTITVAESGNVITVYYTLPLKIEAKTDSKTYDGDPLVGDFTVTGALEADKDKIKLSDAPSITNVADSPKTYKATVTEMPSYYTLADADNKEGTLTIKPAKVTITAKSKDFTYNGTAQSCTEYDVDGLQKDDAIEAVVEGSITFPTESPVENVVKSYKFTKGTASNYEVSKVNGELTMGYAEAAITITAADGEWKYDGKSHTNTTVTVTEGELFTGDELVASASGSVKDVADTSDGNNPVAEGYKVMHGEEDVTENYVITTAAGTLTIKPAAVTITTGSDEKEYDGTALTNDEASIDGLAKGETATVTATGSQTEVGSSDNTYDIDWGETNAENYEVTEELGTLKVKKNTAEVKLTAGSDSKTYDGTALELDKVTASGLPDGFTVEATASGSQTNAGESANVVDDGYVIKNADGEDKTENFTNVKKVDGTLTVEKAAATITTGSDEKEYDGTALTNEEASIDGLVGDDTAEVTATGSQTKVGSSENTYKITWGDTNPDNYEITEELGTLKVTRALVVVTADDNSKVYGEPDPKLTAVIDGLVGDDTIDLIKYIVKRAAGEAVGEYTITPSGEAVQGNYDVAYADGFFEITPAEITDEPEDPDDPDSKRFDVSTPEDVMYNGEKQKQPVTVFDKKTGKELVEDTDFMLFYDSPAIDVGPVEITIEGIGNYSGVVYRTYKITPRKLVLTSASDEKVYDGTALTNDEVTIGGDGLAKTDEDLLSINVTGSQLYVGSSANTFEYMWADEVDEDEEVQTGAIDAVRNYFTVYAAESVLANNYVIEKVEGTLTVTDKGVDPGKVVRKSHEEKTYKEGDVVTFTVEATNIYDEMKTIALEEKDGVVLAQSLFEGVEPGATVKTTATYTITKADADAGEFENVVKAKFNGVDTVFTNTDKVKVEPSEEPAEEPEEEESEGGSGGSPKTGDNGFAGSLIALLGAGAALGVVAGRRRRREDQE